MSILMGTRCVEPEPNYFIASHVERRPLIEDNGSKVLFSVTKCSLMLKPLSTSEFPCDMIRTFRTILANVGYFGNPRLFVKDIILYQ
jgi:hypothetical protein